MAINWDEVKVGETVLVDRGNLRRLVLAVHGDEVWVKSLSDDGLPETYLLGKAYINGTYAIEEPWEEITEECEWIKCEDTFASWYIVHKGKQTVCHESKEYKTDGRRVFKRKERP